MDKEGVMHPLFAPEIAKTLVADRVRAADAARRARRRRSRPSALRRAAGAALVGAGVRLAGRSSLTIHSQLN
jgi:hypothetical protein